MSKHAVPAVPLTAALTASVAVFPAAAAGLIAPPAHAAAVDAPVAQDAPAAQAWLASHARPLVTRIVHTSARKSYTIRSGDTLSGIAGKFCGTDRKWPGVWGQNKAEIHNPDMIVPGTTLRFTCEEVSAAMTAAAMDAIPPPPPPPAPVQAAPQQAPVQATADVSSSGGSYGNVNPNDYSGMQQCIISRESGGNSQVMNSSGHYGLYQFSSSTWAAHGGNPADFGHASPGEQTQVYENTVAADGYSDWAPYDGC